MICGESGDIEGEIGLLRRALELLSPDDISGRVDEPILVGATHGRPLALVLQRHGRGTSLAPPRVGERPCCLRVSQGAPGPGRTPSAPVQVTASSSRPNPSRLLARRDAEIEAAGGQVEILGGPLMEPILAAIPRLLGRSRRGRGRLPKVRLPVTQHLLNASLGG